MRAPGGQKAPRGQKPTTNNGDAQFNQEAAALAASGWGNSPRFFDKAFAVSA